MRKLVTLLLLSCVYQVLEAQPDTYEIRKKGVGRNKPKPSEVISPPKKQPVIISAPEAGAGTGQVRGTIVDATNGEALVNATVSIEGSNCGVLADLDGKFSLDKLPVGTHTLVFYYVGYVPFRQTVEVSEKKITDLGNISLADNAIGLQEIEVVAAIAKDRVTPVASATVDIKYQYERLGSQELPQALKLTPGIFTSSSGGGFGDSRLAVRGFGQEEVSIMINGIPINDMAAGRVFWSNWLGLNDVARMIHVQRGLGASRIASNSIGGTVNIITRTTDIERGGSFSAELSNVYDYKYTLALSSGKTENGWAASFLGSRTFGSGYIDYTPIDAWSYFFSISKEINNRHILSFIALGAPQFHGQRYNRQSVSVFKNLNNNHYNPDWGYLDGQKLGQGDNFYHKPQISLNHYWTLSEKVNITTSAYASWGRGGGGGINGANVTNRDPRLQMDWQAVQAKNRTQKDTVLVSPGDTLIGYASKTVLRLSMNNHDWYGVISTLNYNILPELKLMAGVDVRTYWGHHYRELTHLLGGDFWVEKSFVREPVRIARVGDIIDYEYKTNVNWYGAFSQLEYTKDKLSAFVSLNLSNTFMRRHEFAKNPEGDNGESEGFNFFAYNIKGGLNYNLNKSHNVFANIGYFTRAPFFRFVFFNERYSNQTVKNPVNEKVFTTEIGYGFRSRMFTFQLNGYYTQWRDKGVRLSYQLDGVQGFANVPGMNALHYGVEADAIFQPVKFLTLNGSLSVGDWKWQSDPAAVLISDISAQTKNLNLYLKDIAIADAAQTTAAVGIRLQVSKDFYIISDFTYFDRLYASFDPETRTNENNRRQPWRLPAYWLMDIHTGYSFDFAKFKAEVRGHINNLLDKAYYVEAQDGRDGDEQTARVFYGYGRTYNITLQLNF